VQWKLIIKKIGGTIMSIDVKTASKKAQEYLKDLYSGEDLGTILLEEAELTDGNEYWIITLSFKPLISNPLKDLQKITGREPREYKKIKLDATTGEIRALNIRTIG